MRDGASGWRRSGSKAQALQTGRTTNNMKQQNLHSAVARAAKAGAATTKSRRAPVRVGKTANLLQGLGDGRYSDHHQHRTYYYK